MGKINFQAELEAYDKKIKAAEEMNRESGALAAELQKKREDEFQCMRRDMPDIYAVLEHIGWLKSGFEYLQTGIMSGGKKVLPAENTLFLRPYDYTKLGVDMEDEIIRGIDIGNFGTDSRSTNQYSVYATIPLVGSANMEFPDFDSVLVFIRRTTADEKKADSAISSLLEVLDNWDYCYEHMAKELIENIRAEGEKAVQEAERRNIRIQENLYAGVHKNL